MLWAGVGRQSQSSRLAGFLAALVSAAYATSVVAALVAAAIALPAAAHVICGAAAAYAHPD